LLGFIQSHSYKQNTKEIQKTIAKLRQYIRHTISQSGFSVVRISQIAKFFPLSKTGFPHTTPAARRVVDYSHGEFSIILPAIDIHIFSRDLSGFILWSAIPPEITTPADHTTTKHGEISYISTPARVWIFGWFHFTTTIKPPPSWIIWFITVFWQCEHFHGTTISL
jgi:hypothetical protein